MTAQEHFNTMVKEHVAPFMKQQGFKKSGTSWGLRGRELWGVVALWRETWNTESLVNFSITLGVAFDCLTKHDGFRFVESRIPSSGHTHWHAAVGKSEARRIAEGRSDVHERRLRITTASDIEPVGEWVVHVLHRIAIPKIRRRRNIESFIEMYESSKKNPLGWDDHRFAVLMLHAGRTEQAHKLFVKSLREHLDHPSYAWRVKKLAELGLDAAAIEREARQEPA